MEKYKEPPAWARWLLRHLDKATTPEKAQDVVDGVLRNYHVTREEVIHFVREVNKAVKSLSSDSNESK